MLQLHVAVLVASPSPAHPHLPLPPALPCPQNAVGNRVTLQLAGGGALRVALPFAPSGPLARACLEALHAVLPAETSWALYARWLCTEGAAGAGRGLG